MNKNIVALDIGYGQVKVVSGDSYTRPVTTAIFPAGAAPVELVDTAGFQRGGEFSDGKEVVVNGAVFRALIDPRSIMHGMNNLHREYATTDEYKALFKGALASLESTRFDSLVTGLPISHYKDKERVAQLKSSLVGRHEIRPGQYVDIDHVGILPQGYGAWFWHIQSKPRDYLENDLALVIDFGHFSIDWLAIVNRGARVELSGSSIRGGSSIYDEVVKIIDATYGVQVGREQVQHHLHRHGRHSEWKYGKTVMDMAPIFDKAVSHVSSLVGAEIMGTFREQKFDVVEVIVCGGSAPFFVDMLERTFPRAVIEYVRDPVLANAHGYWMYLQQQSGA